LKNLKNRYVELDSLCEMRIKEYIHSTQLWDNQFLYIHHINSGKYYHKGFDNALGYDVDLLTPDFFVKNIHPTDVKAYYSISRALLTFVMQNSESLIPFKSSFNINYRIKKKDGSYVSILRQSTPFIKTKDKVEAYISLCTDISDIKEDSTVKWHIFGPKSETFPLFLKEEQKDDLAEEKFFSDREMEVLRLLAAGYSSIEITDKLCISINTVNTHRKNLMRKANVNKTVDLIVFGRENKYL
jgi:DNA-binding CsgD family transcriptional regulator